MDNHQDILKWERIAAKLHGELSEEEKVLLEKELEEFSVQIDMKKSQQIHDGLQQLGAVRAASDEESWGRIESYIRTRRGKRFVLQLVKYAAVLVLAFILGWGWSRQEKHQDSAVQYAEVEVLYGQTSHLFLFDGTEVWLNSGTKFRYPNRFNQNERNVFIEGEAFFKVTPNKSLPFKVKTGKMEVEVLGTSFNVSAYPDDKEQSVVLVEGKVQINDVAGREMGKIIPGQIAIRHEGASTLDIHQTDPYFFTSWKDGKVTFSGEKLSEIARKMERWYNVEIRFETESLKDYCFTGTILRNKPIDQTFMAMELLAPIRFKYQVEAARKNIITIEKK